MYAECLCWLTPNKILGTTGHVSFPGWQHFPPVVTHHCWDNEMLFKPLHCARTTVSWCLVSPGLSVSFAFVDFSLYLFTIIIHTCESFFWVLLISFRESLNLRVGQGPPPNSNIYKFIVTYLNPDRGSQKNTPKLLYSLSWGWWKRINRGLKCLALETSVLFETLKLRTL